MLMLTIPLVFTFSILFTQLFHPLAMGLTLLIQTVLISLTVGIFTYSFWFSYILFLVFLKYMSFIHLGNFITFKQIILFFLLFMNYIFYIKLLLSFFYLYILLTLNLSLLQTSFKFLMSTPFIINWIYNTPSMTFTIFMVGYLLINMNYGNKNTNLFKGPLRLSQ
uniref:NADH dehydrogenase subunit 6 n=1 Tax=Metopaulias depressus TaxID=72635 RepID=A0A191TF74_9EUCA|nr:NADH dehydrogenase subunit 6 [Metopaulias depressus]